MVNSQTAHMRGKEYTNMATIRLFDRAYYFVQFFNQLFFGGAHWLMIKYNGYCLIVKLHTWDYERGQVIQEHIYN
jgi:hypothetical protein